MKGVFLFMGNWNYISNCLTMCKVKPYYYVKLEIYFQWGTPCFILPPYSEKKIFGKFCGIYYVCKNG